MTLFTKSAFTKSAVAIVAFGVASVAMAADPIIGNWQTVDDEDGKPKALVTITESNGKLTGKIVKGYTDEAKKYVGKTVIKNLKIDGSGKYSGGTITDPSKNKTYKLSGKLNGSVLKLRGYIGVKALGRTQTWKKK